MTENNSPQDGHDELPQPIVDAIRQRHGPEIQVPESVDSDVLTDATTYLKTTSEPRRRVSRGRKWSSRTLVAGSLAAAAVAMISVLNLRGPAVPDQALISDSSAPAQPMADPAVGERARSSKDDIDRNGRVDILDAFALARTLGRGDTVRADWDQNSDGQVNQDDVDLVALTAVML